MRRQGRVARSDAPAATDRLAPARCATPPAGRQRPRPDARICGGRVDEEVAHPHPSQTRMCRFPASGSSWESLARVLLRCYDFPPRIPGHLFALLPGSTRSSSVRVSQLALPVGRRAFRAGSFVQLATQSAGLLARGRERDLPGSQAIHPVPLPRSTTPAEPTIPRLFDGSVSAAPALPTAKASALHEFRGSITRLRHLLLTLQD